MSMYVFLKLQCCTVILWCSNV